MRLYSHRRGTHGRPAFTLLEVSLALGIAVLLLAGLYISLHTLVTQQKEGRAVMDEAGQARSLVNRISNDIVNQLAPLDIRGVQVATVTNPATGSSSSSNNSSSGSTGTTGNIGNSGTSGSTTSGTGSGQNTSNSGTSSSSSSSSSSTDGSAMNSGAATGGLQPVTFNIGVQGGADRFTLCVSQPLQPRELTGEVNTGSGPLSDLRRISYFFVPGENGQGGGLARFEMRNPTSEDAEADPFTLADPVKSIIAPDVVGVVFEYYDGQAWTQSWDGTQTGADGQAPLGPPMAIAVTLQIRRRDSRPDQPVTRSFRHVIPIPTANGIASAQPDLLGGLLP